MPRNYGAESPAPKIPVKLLAFTAGAVVANLYYNQPLLPEIGRTFGLHNGRVGFISTASQCGYAAGLLFFVPLGDIIERRKLIVVMMVAVAIALAAAAGAPTIGFLAVASFAIGATTIVPQLVIPFAAGLVGPAERGRIVGKVMGGLLIGILAARVVSGFVGAVAGWRTMFALASALMIVLAVVLRRRLPTEPPRAPVPYGRLMRSLITVAREQPVVRDAGTIGALCFFAFSALWTTLAFRLLLPPLHYGSAVAGAFGIVGIVGASVAPLVGRLADRRTPRSTVGIGLWIIVASFLIFTLWGGTLAGLIAGVILIDAGMQVVGVSNQTRVYRLRADLHNRLNTVYMVTYFIGGSVGSAIGVWAWTRWQWLGVCSVSLGALALALIVYWSGARHMAEA